MSDKEKDNNKDGTDGGLSVNKDGINYVRTSGSWVGVLG